MYILIDTHGSIAEGECLLHHGTCDAALQRSGLERETCWSQFDKRLVTLQSKFPLEVDPQIIAGSDAMTSRIDCLF